MTERERIRLDLSKQITDHLARADVPARIGVPVTMLDLGDEIEFLHGNDFTMTDGGGVPGLWFPVTPEAVAKMRELVAVAVAHARIVEGHTGNGEIADAVLLRALGFDGGAP